MEKTANVTVVIPNYNGIKYIDNCLKSLIDGETVPEIIVVDNGSRDGSAEIVEKKYPMCRLVRFKENRGVLPCGKRRNTPCRHGVYYSIK